MLKLNLNDIKYMVTESVNNIVNSKINILIACEESQTITIEFRKLGFNCFSCDLLPSSGGHPEWHIKGDCIPLLNGDNYHFVTEDGQQHFVEHWNLIMGHPECTYLTTAGEWCFNVDKYGDKAKERQIKRQEAAEFFMKFTTADADHTAIENPVGHMSTAYRKPNQIIHPWMWGDNAEKTTCLWTKNLPNLEADVTEKPDMEYKEWVDKNTGKKKRQNMWSYIGNYSGMDKEARRKARSKTFPGIAKAIATQWGRVLTNEYLKNKIN